MYLIDINVISEVSKERRCNPKVSEWYRRGVVLSVLVIGEIRQGIERLRVRSSRRVHALEKWLEELVLSFSERLLPVDEKVAQNWGRLKRSEQPSRDRFAVGASAETHGLILVTRNLNNIERCGVRYLNPFAG
jgi:predicted nucleic acid-binding protein